MAKPSGAADAARATLASAPSKHDSPMRHPEFRRFVLARALSQAGGWMQVVAAGWLIFQLTGSAASVGILAAISKVPMLVGTPIGGTLADRYDRRRLAIWTVSFQALPPAVLAVLALDHDLSTTEIYLWVFAGAVPSAITSPVLQELTPHLVPEPIQRQAMADAAVAFNVARSAGPALGGGLVAAIGVPFAFAINSLSFLLVVAMLLSVPGESAQKGRLGRRGHLSFGGALRAVLQPALLRMLLIAALVFFLYVGPIEQVMPAIASEHGEGAAYIGVLLSALAIGGVAANPVVRRLNQRGLPALIMLGCALSSAGLLLVLLGVSHSVVSDWLILLALGGTWEVVWVVSWATTHFRSPEGLSGEAMGLFLMAASAGVAAGALLAGWFFDTFGIEESLVGAGIFLIGFGVAPTMLVGRRVSDPA
jgi:predicted MFS family arabinose efflux permease